MAAWVGVDLDGTLAVYHHRVDIIGEPVPGIVGIVRDLLEATIEVRIFTARAFDMAGEPIPEQRAMIEEWCLTHLGVVLPITNRKDWDCILILDDRALAVRPNRGHVVGFRYCQPGAAGQEIPWMCGVMRTKGE